MKKIISLLLVIVVFFSVFFYFKEDKSPYALAVSQLEQISKDEVSSKMDNHEDFIVYIGRENCPYCVEFSEQLSEINSQFEEVLYYLDTENFSEEDKEIMKRMTVQFVPSIVKVEDGEPLLLDIAVSTSDILAQMK